MNKQTKRFIVGALPLIYILTMLATGLLAYSDGKDAGKREVLKHVNEVLANYEREVQERGELIQETQKGWEECIRLKNFKGTL